jgi:hypothetical protein
MSGIFKRTRIPRYGAKAVYTNSSGKPAAVTLNIQGLDETKTSTYSVKISDKTAGDVTPYLDATEVLSQCDNYPDLSKTYTVSSGAGGASVIFDSSHFNTRTLSHDPVGLLSDGSVYGTGANPMRFWRYNHLYWSDDSNCNAGAFNCSQCGWTCGSDLKARFDNSKNIENLNWGLDSVKDHAAAVGRDIGYLKVCNNDYYCNYTVASLSNITKNNLFDVKANPSSTGPVSLSASGTGYLDARWQANSSCVRCSSNRYAQMATIDQWSVSSARIFVQTPEQNTDTSCWRACYGYKGHGATDESASNNAQTCPYEAGGSPQGLISNLGWASNTGSNSYSNPALGKCCINCVLNVDKGLNSQIHPSIKHTYVGCDLHIFAFHCCASGNNMRMGVHSTYGLSNGGVHADTVAKRSCLFYSSFHTTNQSCSAWRVYWNTASHMKWLQFDPVRCRNVAMFVGSDLNGFYSIDAKGFERPDTWDNTNTAGVAASECFCVDGSAITYGENLSGTSPVTLIGGLPSNPYGTYNSKWDFVTQPYQVDDCCWISMLPCCEYTTCCHGGNSTCPCTPTAWNGCMYKFASPDLATWTDITDDPVGSGLTFVPSTCEYSRLEYDTSKSINNKANRFFKESVLEPDGLIEIKVDANRYERSGLVVPPGDSIFVTDTSGNESVVQVWGYED